MGQQLQPAPMPKEGNNMFFAIISLAACFSESNISSTKEGDDTGTELPQEQPCTTPGGAVDADCDGYGGTDCDDGNADVYPGATEVCGDGVDQDCDGVDLDCEVEDTGTEDAGQYTTVSVVADVFVVPEGATEMNGWLQTFCEGDECPIVEVMVKRLSLIGALSVLETDFSLLMNEEELSYLEWSGEEGLIGADGGQGDETPLYLPEEFFELWPGEGVSYPVDIGYYAGVLSCNIGRECSRPVEEGETVVFTGTVCRVDDAEVPVWGRFGLDTFEYRNGPWVSQDEGEWFALPRNTCVEVTTQ